MTQTINGHVLGHFLADVEGGHQLTAEEGVALLWATGPAVLAIAAAELNRVRAARAGETVTFVRNQNLNVTNLCVNRCGFCGFSRGRATPTPSCSPSTTSARRHDSRSPGA